MICLSLKVKKDALEPEIVSDKRNSWPYSQSNRQNFKFKNEKCVKCCDKNIRISNFYFNMILYSLLRTCTTQWKEYRYRNFVHDKELYFVICRINLYWMLACINKNWIYLYRLTTNKTGVEMVYIMIRWTTLRVIMNIISIKSVNLCEFI